MKEKNVRVLIATGPRQTPKHENKLFVSFGQTAEGWLTESIPGTLSSLVFGYNFAKALVYSSVEPTRFLFAVTHRDSRAKIPTARFMSQVT